MSPANKLLGKAAKMAVLRTHSCENRYKRWMESLSDEELMNYLTPQMKAELELLETLSNEQLIRVANGEPLSAVLNQERKST